MFPMKFMSSFLEIVNDALYDKRDFADVIKDLDVILGNFSLMDFL